MLLPTVRIFFRGRWASLMVLGSFVLFGAACLLLLVFPPAAFMAWLVSVVMFFVGMSGRRRGR